MIEVAPLAFMRGRALNDSFVILDEAQNTSPEQMKMFLTRLGFGSKMVVTGDITQVDLPRDQRSGLIVVSDILDEVKDISFIRFGGEDVVRHQLVQRIVAAYDEHGERTRKIEATSGLTDLSDVPPELRAATLGRARRPRASSDGHLSVELVDEPSASPSSTATTAATDEPTDVLSFPIDGAGTRSRGRASSATS